MEITCQSDLKTQEMALAGVGEACPKTPSNLAPSPALAANTGEQSHFFNPGSAPGHYHSCCHHHHHHHRHHQVSFRHLMNIRQGEMIFLFPTKSGCRFFLVFFKVNNLNPEDVVSVIRVKQIDYITSRKKVFWCSLT